MFSLCPIYWNNIVIAGFWIWWSSRKEWKLKSRMCPSPSKWKLKNFCAKVFLRLENLASRSVVIHCVFLYRLETHRSVSKLLVGVHVHVFPVILLLTPEERGWHVVNQKHTIHLSLKDRITYTLGIKRQERMFHQKWKQKLSKLSSSFFNYWVYQQQVIAKIPKLSKPNCLTGSKPEVT